MNNPQLPRKPGDSIPVKRVWASSEATAATAARHLIDEIGLSGPAAGTGRLHDNDAGGATMWLSVSDAAEPASVTFDFGATYPVGDMHVWNYNQENPAYPGLCRRGMRRVDIAYSIDGKRWERLQGDGFPYELAPADGSKGLPATNLNDGSHTPVRFGGALARYIRISVDAGSEGNWGGFAGRETCCGLSAVRFQAAQGLAAEPAEDWTRLLVRKSGWSGSDGIYSIPFNGMEAPGNADRTKTLFLFGDTFVGEVETASDSRLAATMVNNSLAVLEGGRPDPERIRFIWDQSVPDQPRSAFVPTTPRALAEKDTYYWLQDGTCVNGKFYCFPLIIGPDLSKPEGFQFAVHGVTRISAPMGGDGPLFAEQVQIDTPLYYRSKDGHITYFGAAVMPNTEEAGAPNPDGYVYVYGLQQSGGTKLVAARVPNEYFEDIDRWMYWDGTGWTNMKEHAAPIADETSSEVSVSPMTGGFLDGKYIVAYQQGGTGNYVCVYAGESPVGPFKDPVRLHYCAEPDAGGGIYAYNAKGHPHLSAPGELLVSYSVNTTSWDAHNLHADIYRPRFINIVQIV